MNLSKTWISMVAYALTILAMNQSSSMAAPPSALMAKDSAGNKDISKIEKKQQVSAELRWFWKSEPQELKKWFLQGSQHRTKIPEDKFEERRDHYLFDKKQQTLGIKKRGNTSYVEIKGLLSREKEVHVLAALSGPMEIWSKWKSNELSLIGQPCVTLTKIRWLRKFDTSGKPEEVDPQLDVNTGCNVEYTSVTVGTNSQGDNVWFTFGLEAFGEPGSVQKSLEGVIELLKARGLNVTLTPHTCSDYPKWIGQNCASDAHLLTERDLLEN